MSPCTAFEEKYWVKKYDRLSRDIESQICPYVVELRQDAKKYFSLNWLESMVICKYPIEGSSSQNTNFLLALGGCVLEIVGEFLFEELYLEVPEHYFSDTT